MKISYSTLSFIICGFVSLNLSAQTNKGAAANDKKLFIDVHQLEPGKVKFEDVAEAHIKDLAIEKKHGVHFVNYWVDEEKGLIYCLSSATDSSAVRKTHEEAHGLLPVYTLEVTEGVAAPIAGGKKLFLDIHQVGAGNVNYAEVEDAHKKDLAVQEKYDVNFINYWVAEKEGLIMCLSEANNAEAVIATHNEAHGLVPAEIRNVKQGE